MRKTLLQRISEETGCDLTPIGIARDRRLRVLYEAYMEAKDDSAKEIAYKKFVQFIREEYP
jgi:hypothetical protein